MIEAILYDLDGVLVDAREWHYLSLNMALNEVCGIVIDRVEHEVIFNGIPTHKKIDILIKQGRVNPNDRTAIWERKQEYTKKAIQENASIDYEKIELHKAIRAKDIRIACVTNSITETARMMLQMTGQYDYMDFLVTNEQVRHPKPHGEGFIRAMVQFGVMPEETLVVEDSDKGILAAEATGAFVLRVGSALDVTREKILYEVERCKS